MEKKMLDGTIVEWDPKPTNNEVWWLRSHCGPGSLDVNEICGFCGENVEDCAKWNTQCISERDEMCCGGSGFWCPECGLFYPQDACGETYDEEYETVNGEHVIVNDGKVFCKCGCFLFNVIN